MSLKANNMKIITISLMLKSIILLTLLLFVHPIINAQWVQQNSGTNQDFWGVYFANENIGYAGGGPWQFTSSCVISKTEDGGVTWQSQNPVTFPSCIFGVNALNSDTVFAVGCNANNYYGLILRSFDGGENWTTKNISNTWGFYCIEFPTESIGYTCGWNGRIYKTENTGETWTLLSSGSSQTFRRMHFVNENLGFAACGSDHASTNRIYKTTDGSNWSMITNFGSSFIIGGMHFFDENTGIVVGTNGSKAAIKRTIDGGENWDDVLNENYTFVLECLDFEGRSGWAAGKYGTNNGILHSADSGQTWEINYTGLSGTPYSVFQFDTVTFIAGTSGMIMKHEGVITNIDKKAENKKLLIYPVPAKEILTIDFTGIIEELDFEIFNLNGSIVMSGNNIGNKQKSIDVESWPSGIYLFKANDKLYRNHYSNKIIIN